MSLQFQGELTEIYSGGQTGPTSRWVATNWIDKVLFATPSVIPLYWQPGLSDTPQYRFCRPIPGLPDQTGYDGIEVFAGHVILWKGSTVKGSDLNDFACWIPVAVAPSSGRGVLAEDFRQPATGTISGFVYLRNVSGSFVAGQYVRVVSDEDDPSKIAYSYYKVDAAASSTSRVPSIDATQTVPPVSAARIYTTTPRTWLEGARLAVGGNAVKLTVTGQSRAISAVTYQLSATSSAVPVVGSTISLPLSAFPHALAKGDVVSVGSSDLAGRDLYEVTAVGQTLVARRLGVGSAQGPVGSTYASGSYVKFQPWVSAANVTDTSVTISAEAQVSEADGLRLESLGYSGGLPADAVVRTGSVLETLGVNEAVEFENVGAAINGDIYAVVTLADYAYILKRESIQSMQYIGGSDPYRVRAEIFEEGPIGRYAWCRYDNKAIVFWGHKGWFSYAGGQVLTAVGSAHWDQVDAELDRARVDEIVAFHNRPRSEVWFAYPVLGGGPTKVAIINYDSGSVVVDEYDESLNGITSLGLVDWEVAPTWESLPDTERWDCQVRGSGTTGLEPDLEPKRWYEYVEDGLQARTLIGIGGDEGNLNNGEDPDETIPRLLVHGRVWHRASRDDCDPQAYEASAETPDFDFRDPQAVKYVEGVYLHLHVPVTMDGPMRMKVQIGTRSGLDAAIVWSTPASVEVSGNGNIVTKVDLRAAGRLVRLRFISDERDVRWEVSAYTMIARVGTVY